MTRPGPFLIFVAIGGAASAVNVLARILFDLVMSYELAIVAAFPVALTFAFVLNRLYVFNAASGETARQFSRFLLVNLLALVQVFVVSVALARGLFPAVGLNWHGDTLAHLIGVASPVLTSYFAHKHFSFSPGRAETTP